MSNKMVDNVELWVADRCILRHQYFLPSLFTGIIKEQIKDAFDLFCLQSVQSKTQQHGPSSSCLFVSTLVTQTSANNLVLILLGCANKGGRQECIFFKVENVRACVFSPVSVSLWSVSPVSVSLWSVSPVSVVAHLPASRRSHPTNPLACPARPIHWIHWFARRIHWLRSQDIVPPFFLSLHLVFR